MLRGLQVFVSGIALAGFTLAGAAVASAQDAPAAPVMALDGDAAVITILIKPDKTGFRERDLEVQRGAGQE